MSAYVTIVCNHCQATFESLGLAIHAKTAYELAERDGWHRQAGKDFCPACWETEVLR